MDYFNHPHPHTNSINPTISCISSNHFKILQLCIIDIPHRTHSDIYTYTVVHDCLHNSTRIIRPPNSVLINLSVDPTVNIMSDPQAPSKLNHSWEIPIQPAYIPSTMLISTSATLLGLTTAAAILLCYLSWITIYRLHLSPISSFPGPRLAALTFWSVIIFPYSSDMTFISAVLAFFLPQNVNFLLYYHSRT